MTTDAHRPERQDAPERSGLMLILSVLVLAALLVWLFV